MKILLVCAGGMSTSILMNSIKKYCEEKGEDLSIEAVGVGGYLSVWKDYDCILMGPQVRYQKDAIQENVDIPVDVIDSFDYAVGNAEKIMAIAHNLVEKERK